MRDMTPEKAQALLDGAQDGDWRVLPRSPGFHVINPDGDAELGNWSVAECWWEPDAAICAEAKSLARAYIAQAAEITRLRARIEAADKLAEALADTVGALDAAGEELSDFANILSRDPWEANHAYEGAVQARAALSAYEEALK